MTDEISFEGFKDLDQVPVTGINLANKKLVIKLPTCPCGWKSTKGSDIHIMLCGECNEIKAFECPNCGSTTKYIDKCNHLVSSAPYPYSDMEYSDMESFNNGVKCGCSGNCKQFLIEFKPEYDVSKIFKTWICERRLLKAE